MSAASEDRHVHAIRDSGECINTPVRLAVWEIPVAALMGCLDLAPYKKMAIDVFPPSIWLCCLDLHIVHMQNGTI